MISVVVTDRRVEAQDICSFKFEAVDGDELPTFDPGAHIDVHLSNGLVRQYSLCERTGYRIAVLKEPLSRGGSTFLHEQVGPGTRLSISSPRNNFLLDADSDHAVLLAGGIGITPLICMAELLQAEQRSFELHYCARSPEKAAFLERLFSSRLAPRTRAYFDNASIEQRFSAREVLATPRARGRVYVCGPSGFMDFIHDVAAKAGWSQESIRREYFSTSSQDSIDEAFDVLLARSNMTVHVPAHMTLAEALIGAGVDLPISCEQGLCGTCTTRVLGGEPIHRDQVLKQRASLEGLMTPCVSRARKTGLILDL